MSHKFIGLQAARFALLIVALVLSASMRLVVAQDATLDLTQTAEYDIGLKCPVTAALDPAGTTYWVLMDNCFQNKYALHAYNIADGTQVNTDDYADALATLQGVYIDLSITPLGFTPSGDLSLRYNHPETYGSINLLIPLASGGEVTTQSSAAYDALLAEYSQYPEFSVYSPDHTRVVAVGPTSFHILDVQAETEIVEISAEDSLAAFSADGTHLQVVRSNTTGETDDHASTLLIYSLPDGELLNQYPVPSSAVWVSPDETSAVVQLFSNNVSDLSEIVVVNLKTGLTSPASNLLEKPAPVTTCLNTGNNMSDVGLMTSGYFTMPSLHWLPDSSGLILPLSSNGDGAQGDRGSCIFNYSRLRTYSVREAG
jgi:hypothetical protein